ncbi:MAG TPA: hypothetical protein VHR45_10240 [Thermoanaerobaculia bacterium]|nr:hypothetical protein [Thermoanaerobaculia bacterium]
MATSQGQLSSDPMPGLVGRLALGLLLASLALGGCASNRGGARGAQGAGSAAGAGRVEGAARAGGAAEAGGAAGASAMAGPSTAAAEAWQIPPDALGSQRLYRVTYSGSEGEGSLRLTLRLAAPERYQVQAVDPLGRAVWALAVSDGVGLWLDHRRHVFCRFADRFDLPFLRLGPLPLPALPALLLGRLPVAPAAPQAEGPADSHPDGRDARGDTSYRDPEGRLWKARLRDGRLLAWSLEEHGAPALSWVESGGWMILSDRRKALQVRWKESLRERLEELPPISVPPGHSESCGGQ